MVAAGVPQPGVGRPLRGRRVERLAVGAAGAPVGVVGQLELRNGSLQRTVARYRGRVVRRVLWSAFGAVVLAATLTGVAFPLARLFVGWGVHGPLALLALFGVLLVPCGIAVAVMERDARRLVAAGDRRRQRLLEIEERLDGVPLPFACDPAEFLALVEAEHAALPGWVHAELERLRVSVGVDDRREGAPSVLGVYERRPLARQSWGGAHVDEEAAITLYRLPLVRLAGVPSALPDAVRETLLHEVGHALGMSEGDLDRYTIGNHPRPDALPVRPRDDALREPS
jgi:predicted Zn-dependent protease with MMP-like domain